jgi:hypothetical protein
MASRKSKSRAKAKKTQKSKASVRGSLRQPTGIAAKGESSDSPELVAMQLKPRSHAGEGLEDLAVFAKEYRGQLTPELRAEALVVGEALDLVYEGDFSSASARLQTIARSSPYADWRLFVRGLIAFYHGNSDSARQSWGRLDPTRRPARIANVLWRAESASPLENEVAPPPADLIQAAVTLLLRRAAIAAARRIASVKHRNRETFFTASQVAMLNDFRDRFRRVDGELYSQFSQACVRLACRQPQGEIFRLLKKSVPGPPHDPNWNLQGALYWSLLRGGFQEQETCSQAYLAELPKVEQLTKPLRNAIASQLCLKMAQEEIELTEQSMGLSFRFTGEFPDYREAEAWFEKAIGYYPTHRAAHHARLNLLKKMTQQLPDERPVQKRLVAASEALVKTFPDEVETTLWLIDSYVDDDRLKEADTLVRQLQHQRLDDPLAKGLPWKLKLREAMHLSRRKANLPKVLEALREAEAHWPAWYGRDWLLFLHAAAELRGGNSAQFNELNRAARQACAAPEWVGDIMLFASLQQMNLPSATVKPFRAAVETHIKNASTLPLMEFARLASFLWDLTRAGLRYKGYRTQASKIGRVLNSRLANGEQIEDPKLLLDACSWIASHNFWIQNYGTKEPEWVARLASSEPRAAADVLEFVSRLTFIRSRIFAIEPQIQLVKDASKTENDPYYRHRFEKLAKEFKARVAEFEDQKRRNRSYATMDPWDMDDEDEDEDDAFSEFFEDGECNCRGCRAERAREAAEKAKRTASRSDATPSPTDDRQKSTGWFERDDDEELADEYGGDDDDEFDSELEPELLGNAGPTLRELFTRIGLEAFIEIDRLFQDIASRGHENVDSNVVVERFVKVLVKSGMSRNEANEFWTRLQLDASLDDWASAAPRRTKPLDAPIPAAAHAQVGGQTSRSDFEASSSEPEPTAENEPGQPRRGKISDAERRRRQREKKRNRGRQ